MNDESKCQLCGEPMPAGEEMFNYHGYSGPCPKPPSLPEAVAGNEAGKRCDECEWHGCAGREHGCGCGCHVTEMIEGQARLDGAVAENASAPVGEKRQPSGVGEPRNVKQRAYHDCLTIARSFGGVIAGRIQEAIARTADEAYAADGPVEPREVGEGLREAQASESHV